MRNRLANALKEAMKAKDAARLSTLRLINAAIKDREIAARTEENNAGISNTEVLEVLAKMIRQRQESARTYEEAGRLELAERERAEIKVISEFMPKPLDAEETRKAVRDAILEVGATSIRDMGKIMGYLKGHYAGRMDFGKVGVEVKDALAQ